MSTAAYVAELPALIEQIGAGTIALTALPRPLAEVEAAWAATDPPGARTVLVP